MISIESWTRNRYGPQKNWVPRECFNKIINIVVKTYVLIFFIAVYWHSHHNGVGNFIHFAPCPFPNNMNNTEL